ncbi:DUF6092 family protein [Streptomyces sp. NPDC003077]|uniref:DUF6092 family protein n=1 Tax=Streptomyces sp. NPDC003077 TaxID=3154443 RepID=UPI00339F45FA
MTTSADTDHRRLHEDLTSLAAYLLSVGRGLLEEPDDYPPLRCVDAARRTLAVLETHTTADPRLVELRAKLEDAVTAPPEADPPPMEGLLDDLCMTMARIIKDSG